MNITRIPIIPEIFSRPCMCSLNVAGKINRDGGQAVFGWRVYRDSHYDRHAAHCVWQSPDGNLIDVTPSGAEIAPNGDVATVFTIGEVNGHIEFIPDPEVEWQGNQAPVSRYVPRDPTNRDLELACRYLRRSEQAELEMKTARNIAKKWDEVQRWNAKASRHLSRATGQRIRVTMTI